MLTITDLITPADLQYEIDWALQHANAHEQQEDHALVQRTGSIASLQAWFIRRVVRLEDLTLLTRRQKEVLQRRPALLAIVREYGMHAHAEFAKAEYQRRMDAADAARPPAHDQRPALLSVRHRRVDATDHDIAIMTDEDYSSQLTPLCNSLIE